ncbi:helix-turn-helix domain-containing protein [Kineosporia sp. J2-2]|uniref:Helix-turn-helix domain-containing protein n=1 Tax=Kineosporia corallincola TaxID=2835133 RepID=A0ABS5TBJ1_9ACTN|nr:helix-turn-helix transcriptional regulator [Kineosporia corallincola]MBT0768439.1 helix-turn-helix domain-containing protein [Kineosporia corallincola]
MEPAALADFLRTRRERMQPEDLGLPHGERRRTRGLRREEVAAAAGMSADYYSRMERAAGPRPSEQMIAALARGLRLSLPERDYLFRIAGYEAPQRILRTDHVDAGLMRVVDRLVDTPAVIMNALGETLVQTPAGVALLGDHSRYQGLSRSAIHRWFTDPAERLIYPPADRAQHSRVLASHLRDVIARSGPQGVPGQILAALEAGASDFAQVWAEHPVGVRYSERKRLLHPEVGELDLHCQTLLDPEQAQTLLVFTASPGSASQEKLELLGVIGAQRLG